MTVNLIADAGSTKIEWRIVGPGFSGEDSIFTEGINASMALGEAVLSIFREVAESLPHDVAVENIYYYGAGCSTPKINLDYCRYLNSVWPDAGCHVESDMLAAARSLLGHSPGIACILGTGSNSCLYDGKEIVRKVPSLGYIMGDEGSGAVLGRRLMSEMYSNRLTPETTALFESQYRMTLPELIERVYRKPAANRFLASFMPFIVNNIHLPEIYQLVKEEFGRFFRLNICQYAEAKSLGISFTGSVAFYLKDILLEVARELGYTVSKVTRSPMPGLMEFHNSKMVCNG